MFESSRSRIELQSRTIFTCDRCTGYSGKVICESCFPCKVFPPSYKVEKQPPKLIDYKSQHDWYSDFKHWDRWYMWRYMTEFVFDDEQLYEIGSEWFDHEIESSACRKSLRLKGTKKPILMFKRCWQYSWKECETFIYILPHGK